MLDGLSTEIWPVFFYSKPYFCTKDYKCPDLGICPDLGMPTCTTIKVRRYPNMGFTTNLASGHYLSSMKTMILLRICF